MKTLQEKEDFLQKHHDFIYRTIARKVYSLAKLHKTGRYIEITDDIFQSFFVYLFTHEDIPGNWRGEGSFESYLYKVVYYFTIKEFYRNHVQKEIPLDDNPFLLDKIGPVDKGSHPEDEPQSDIRNLLDFLIDRLRSDRDKRFIHMYYFEEMSYEEISPELETSIENLYIVHHRAVKRLRKIAHLKKNREILQDLEDFRNS